MKIENKWGLKIHEKLEELTEWMQNRLLSEINNWDFLPDLLNQFQENFWINDQNLTGIRLESSDDPKEFMIYFINWDACANYPISFDLLKQEDVPYLRAYFKSLDIEDLIEQEKRIRQTLDTERIMFLRRVVHLEALFND